MACKEQEEQKMMALCKKILSPKAVQNVFIFTYDRLHRYKGAWHLERKLLFPSHVFLESENEEILLKELKKYSVTAKYGNQLIRMDKEEEQFLKILCGKEHHLRMSRGIISKGETLITDGPLKGMENRICKIDRHKRLARVTVTTRQECSLLPAGLEITEKVI